MTIRQEKGEAWGAAAITWLMTNKNLTYVQANQLLTKVNLRAILHSPILYGYQVAQSLIYFHVPFIPRWPLIVRAPALAAEAILIALFLLLTMLWCGYHILMRVSPLVSRSCWTKEDTLIAFAEAIYWYAAVVSSAIDFGKPEHRAPVEFLMPLAIVLVAHRLKMSFSSLRSRPAPAGSNAQGISFQGNSIAAP